ncbi:hypothetical protein [Taklimakanibacter deserti]|uniref:hypothetical protein n=1 Tax=Taklimakanibacter deserti TaxID=2267839 RepID=UPI000E65A3CE
MRDMHDNIKVLRAIEPKAIGTSGAANGSLSPILDRRGYDAAEFVILHGTAGATGDTTTPVVLESDTAVSADFTSVANADLLGTEAGAGLPVEATARTSGVGKNIATKLGYIGRKRYLRLRLYGLGHATGIVAAALVLSKPERAPITSQVG